MQIQYIMRSLLSKIFFPRSKQYKEGYNAGLQGKTTKDNPYTKSAKGIKEPDCKYYDPRLWSFNDWTSGLIRGLHDSGHI